MCSSTCCRKVRTSWTVFKTSRCTIIGRVMYHRLCNCQNKTQNRETRKVFTYNYRRVKLAVFRWRDLKYVMAEPRTLLDGERLSDDDSAGPCRHGCSPSRPRQVSQLEQDVHFHRGHLAKPLGSNDELLYKTGKI